MPLHSPIGYGPLDYFELAVAAILVALVFIRGTRLARHPLWCVLLVGALPVTLRLLLLSRFPVPVPDIYDEFGHLLVADTLRHGRLANPPHALHQFFETFFVLQQPSYSSIYPIGNGLALAPFPSPWVAVLLLSGAFCALCYWMLRAFATPGWALAGGLLAAMEFGPLNQWTNSYWGGGVAAVAGCLVFGALPRGNAMLLGVGLGLHLLTRPFESVFLFATAATYLLFVKRSSVPWAAMPFVLIALSITALQNKQVTGSWTTLPYTLSQQQYGVPATLTFQADAIPHLPLTREQQLEYRVQREFHHGPETLASYFGRLLYRTRYYRFFFMPPLYLALAAYLFFMRTRESCWIAGACLLFALGTNFFPAFQYHYLAGIACLFVLLSVRGLAALEHFRHGPEAARAIVFLCVAQFAITYALARPEYVPQRRIDVARQLAATPGRLLVFVRYWPNHVFQNEWVYNRADIDAQRIVMARDLGDDEDLKLVAYYRNREAWLLEPDAKQPLLSRWRPVPKPAEKAPAPVENTKPPLLQLEQVR